MNDFNKSNNSIMKTQKIIEHLTIAPFDSYLKEQERMNKMFSPLPDLVGGAKLTDIISLPYTQIMQNLVGATKDLDLLEFNGLINKQVLSLVKGVTSEQTITSAMSAGLGILANTAKNYQCDITNTLTQAFSANASTSKQLINMQGLTPLLASIPDIAIHSNYVSVPEVLIPDAFEYHEIPNHTEIPTMQRIDESCSAKKLSLSDALNIINMMVVILVAILAPFYNCIVERSLSEKENTDYIAPLSEEQVQQMLEYISELTTYQQSILTVLETSEESTQEHGSYFDDIQHHFATPDSATSEFDESHSTFSDESNKTEQH